ITLFIQRTTKLVSDAFVVTLIGSSTVVVERQDNGHRNEIRLTSERSPARIAAVRILLRHSLTIVSLLCLTSRPALGNQTPQITQPQDTPDCSQFSKQALPRIACEDPTAARFLTRIRGALKGLDKVISPGAKPALAAHQNRWEVYADSWLSTLPDKPNSMRCSSPRALLFQRMDALEKAILSIRESRPKSIDVCYDNGACLEPGSVNTEMICETIYLGMENVPANAEPIVVKLLGQWTAEGRPFETRIIKSMGAKEPCETVSESSLVEYLRGGYVTIRYRQGDTCNPQGGSEQLNTFDLRSGRTLQIQDFAVSPQALLTLLRQRKEADVLQALLRKQLLGDDSRPHIEPTECAQLPFATFNELAIHVTGDGLRVNRLFKKPPRELASCQFKVEEGISPSTMAQLLRGKKTSPASGMLRYVK
ncbi:MAG: hypothetical protein RL189_1602, partial [Pseudomonadota bacterium]